MRLLESWEMVLPQVAIVVAGARDRGMPGARAGWRACLHAWSGRQSMVIGRSDRRYGGGVMRSQRNVRRHPRVQGMARTGWHGLLPALRDRWRPTAARPISLAARQSGHHGTRQARVTSQGIG